MWFHMGPNMHQRERIYIQTMNAMALGIRNAIGNIITLSTPEMSNRNIGVFDRSLHIISKQRADLGAYYTRLEHAAKGLMNAYENIQASESRIRDADIAETTVEYTKSMVLVQSGTAMLAQANQKTQSVLQLLR